MTATDQQRLNSLSTRARVRRDKRRADSKHPRGKTPRKWNFAPHIKQQQQARSTWSQPITLDLPGNPRPAPRPRVTKRGAYNPAWYRQQLERWQCEARSQMAQAHAAPLSGPVGVSIEFYRQDRRTADPDNLTKGVLDALNGVVFGDDRQVDSLHVTVCRGVGRDAAKTAVTVWPLE